MPTLPSIKKIIVSKYLSHRESTEVFFSNRSWDGIVYFHTAGHCSHNNNNNNNNRIFVARFPNSQNAQSTRQEKGWTNVYHTHTDIPQYMSANKQLTNINRKERLQSSCCRCRGRFGSLLCYVMSLKYRYCQLNITKSSQTMLLLSG